MKKIYNKPNIFFEDFRLSSNIAGNCNIKTNTQDDENTCGGYDDNGTILFASLKSCEYTQYQDFGLCYHVPTGSSSVFVS